MTNDLGLTVSQAATQLGVSVSTLRRWSNEGRIRGYRTPGGQRRFPMRELDAFLEALEPAGVAGEAPQRGPGVVA